MFLTDQISVCFVHFSFVIEQLKTTVSLPSASQNASAVYRCELQAFIIERECEPCNQSLQSTRDLVPSCAQPTWNDVGYFNVSVVEISSRKGQKVIHSGYFYSASSSLLLLLRGSPVYSIDTVSELTLRSTTIF